MSQVLTNPAAGRALEPTVRGRLEPLLGEDLGSVQVHGDPAARRAARDIRAKAFTHGDHIYLGAGASAHDVGLMAHEATHVVQQRKSSGLPVQRNGEDEYEAPDPSEETLALADEDLTRTIRSDTLPVMMLVPAFGGLRGMEQTHPQAYLAARDKMERLFGRETVNGVYQFEPRIRNLAYRSELITGELFELLGHFHDTDQDTAHEYINSVYDTYDFSYGAIVERYAEHGQGAFVILELVIGGDPYEVADAIQDEAEALQARQVALERERAEQTAIGQAEVGTVVGTQEILFWPDDTVTLEALLEPTYGFEAYREAMVFARISGRAVALREIQDRYYLFRLNEQYDYGDLQAWSDAHRTDFVRTTAGRGMTVVTTDGVVLNAGHGQRRFYSGGQYGTGDEDFAAAASIVDERGEELSYDTQYELFKDMLRSLVFQNLENVRRELSAQLDDFFHGRGFHHFMNLDPLGGAELQSDTARLRRLLVRAAEMGNELGEEVTEDQQRELLQVLSEIGELQTNNPLAALFVRDANAEAEASQEVSYWGGGPLTPAQIGMRPDQYIVDELAGMQSGDAAVTAARELGRRKTNAALVQRHILENPDAVLKLTPLHGQVLSRFDPLAQDYIRLRLGLHSLAELAEALGLAVAEVAVVVAGTLIGGPVGFALTGGATLYGASQAVAAFDNLATLEAMSELDVAGRVRFASPEQVESARFWAYVGAGLTLLDLAGFASSARAMTRASDAISSSADLAGISSRTEQNLATVAEIMGETEQSLVARLNAANRSQRARLDREIGEIMEIVGPHGDDLRTIGSVSDDTIDLFRRQPSLVESYADNALARQLLKHCTSPCFPEGLIPAQVDHIEDFLEELTARGLSLEDIGTSPQRVRTSLEAASEDAAWDILVDLERRLDTTADALGQSRRGSALYDEAHLGSEIDEGLSGVIGRHMTTVEGAHDVGVSMGREHATQVLGLREANWVNPFEFRRSRFGQGFDDVLEDASGNLWIVEYKGGAAQLSQGQMTRGWVVSRIARYRREGGELGRFMANRLEAALNSGRLRGVALSTPIEGRTVGQTTELGRWTY